MFPILLPEVRGFVSGFTDYIKRFSGNMQGLNIHHIRLASHSIRALEWFEI